MSTGLKRLTPGTFIITTAGGCYMVGNGQGSMTFCGDCDVEEGGFQNTGLISVTPVSFRTFPVWLLVTGPSR